MNESEIESASTINEADIAVSDEFFKEYPAFCWTLVDGALELKLDADTLMSDAAAARVVSRAAMELASIPDIIVSPIEFKLLFTAPERIAIKTARATDPVVDDFFEIVEDPRLTSVNLSLQSTQDAIAYLEATGLILQPRVAEILTGVFL